MTDSSDMTITYRAIIDRAEQDAREYMPDLPKENTFDAWESFQQAVEYLDAFDIAAESCEWDWVIYYARALELCQAVPSDVLNDATDRWQEFGGFDMESESDFTLYGFACRLAGLIVMQEIAEAVERVKDELIDLAETQMENL